MIKLWLKRNLYRFRYREKKLKIGRGVILDMHNWFGGHNAIYKNCEIAGSSIGEGTYVASHSVIRKTRVGRYCSIGSNVQSGIGTHPTRRYVSTHPAFFSTQGQAGFSFVQKDSFEEHTFIDADRKFVVEIGNDVWIGSNVILVDGIKIGNGAIIAAGAVVTKDVPDYAIFAGVPAKMLRQRFTDAEVQKLNALQWWNWDYEALQARCGLFNNIDDLLRNAQ